MKQHTNYGNVQNGVALAVLLWMIAALALMAAGIVLMARVDVKLAQIQTRSSQVAALGDGLVNVAMRELIHLQQSGEYQTGQSLQWSLTFAEQNIVLRIVPSSGLVDINQASNELWRVLLAFGAGIDSADVELLLENIEQWRHPASVPDGEVAPRQGVFLAVEDLMLVDGMTREIFEKLRPFIHIYGGGTGIDLRAAPIEMLTILASGNRSLAQQLMSERSGDKSFMLDSYPGIPPELVGTGGSVILRVDVRLTQQDGSVMQYGRWVQPGAIGRDGLPWRRLRAEPVINVTTADFSMSEEGAWH